MPPLLSILAELPDPQSPAAIGWLLMALGGLFLALNQGADFIARFRKKDAAGTEILGQPLEVRPSPEYARREELAAVVLRQDRLEQKFEKVAKDLADAGEDRVRRIHARTDVILAAVSRVEGELKRLPCDRCAG